MTIEEKIEDILARDNLDARALSWILFGPIGLFLDLGKSEVERRAIVQTDLFKRANHRVTELIYQEAYGKSYRANVDHTPLNGAVQNPKGSSSDSARTAQADGQA